MRGTEVDASAVARPRAILGSELIAEEAGGGEAVCEERCGGDLGVVVREASTFFDAPQSLGEGGSTPSLFFATAHTRPQPSIPGENLSNSTQFGLLAFDTNSR